MAIPGSPNNHGGLLPPWATEDMINTAVRMTIIEADNNNRLFEEAVTRGTTEMVNEAEAMLKHVSEGW